TALVFDGTVNSVGPAGTGGYRLHYARLPGANEGGALPNGGSVVGNLTSGDLDTYTFALEAGDTFALRSAEFPGSTFFSALNVYGPDGALVVSDSGSSVAAVGGTAPLTGTYTALVFDSTANSIGPNGVGDYELHYVRLPGANEGGALPNGSSVLDELTAGDLDSYTFELDAGDSFNLRSTRLDGGTFFSALDIYGPDGTLVTSDSGTVVATVGGTAPLTGTYTALVFDSTVNSFGPNGTGGYELHFVRLPGANEGGALPNGGSVLGSLTPGDLDTYTFALDAGDSFLLRSTELAGGSFFSALNIYGPGGDLVVSDSGSVVAAVSGIAPLSGTYTALVFDSTANSVGPNGTGDYQLHYVRLPGASEGGTLPVGGTTAGDLTAGDLDSFALTLEAGESYQLRLAELPGSTFFVGLSLYGPNGALVASDSGSVVASLAGTAPLSGSYTALVFDATASSAGPTGTGAYRLDSVRIPGGNEGGTLVDGQTVNGTIELGDLDSYSFLALGGASIQIDVSETAISPLVPSVQVYQPSGAFFVGDTDSATATVAFAAPFDGIYTVVVRDGTSGTSGPTGTGDYTLALLGDVSPPLQTPNLLLPSFGPNEPTLSDIGGSPLAGPRIGSLSEPFNFELDCSSVQGPSLYVIQAFDNPLGAPLLTPFGLLYVGETEVLSALGFHNGNSVTWFPAPTGLVLPNDIALVGFGYAVQGFCGNPFGGGRLSNAVLQVISL
ncbi:MAG: hypothetical protein AAFZ65_08320, partial [Planctomycetota bacterium]